MKPKSISIPKPEECAINEDAAIALDTVVAVADGAGGGGVFAEEWSKYLLDKLPLQPFPDFAALDQWVDAIWEDYYNRQETVARNMNDPMLLNKFYDEGSFSTLVAIWRWKNSVKWVSYGDSTAFCYNTETKELSFTCRHLTDYGNAPYLISCKDPLQERGFNAGTFTYSWRNVYFVTSDALAHYIVMMYMVANKDRYEQELRDAMNGYGKNANYVRVAMSLKAIDFAGVLQKLFNCIGHKTNMERHLGKLRRNHLLAVDDYSMAMMTVPRQLSIF